MSDVRQVVLGFDLASGLRHRAIDVAGFARDLWDVIRGDAVRKADLPDATVLALLRSGLPVHGLAHITGGGLARNLERVLYFASYLVTEVDESAREASILEVRELVNAEIEELRAATQVELDEIDDATSRDTATLSEGQRSLSEAIASRRESELADLLAEAIGRPVEIEAPA